MLGKSAFAATDHQRIEVSDDEAVVPVQKAAGKMDTPSADAIFYFRAQFSAGKIHWARIWSLVVPGHYLKRVEIGPRVEGTSQTISA